MKKVLSIILMAAFVLTLLASCGSGSGNGSTVTTAATTAQTQAAAQTIAASTESVPTSGKLFDQPVKLSMMVASNTTYPTNPEDFVFKAIAEETNVQIDWTIVPDPDYLDKANMVIASGDLPDIMDGNNINANKYGQSGAYINLKDYLDKAPNFRKYFEAKEWQPIMRNFIATDGGMYGFPNLAVEGNCRHLWFYRKDIFDANNLKAPENYDEIYNVCKTLKGLYPDLYPLYFCRFLLDNNDNWNELRHMAISWGTGYPYFFDEKAQVWKLALEDPGLKGLIEWFNKMYNAKLLPPDFITMTQDQYREMLSAGKGFMTMYYSEDLDRYNKTLAANNESGYFEWMKPPAGMINGQNLTFSMAFYNSEWSISSKSKNIDNAIKYCDWFYTDAAKDLVSWGKEGETFKAADGKKQYIIPAGRETDGYRKVYGFEAYGSCRVLDVLNMKLSSGEPRWAEGFKAEAQYEYPLPPVPALNEEETMVWDNLEPTLITKMNSEIANFMMGKRSLEEWDSFVKEMKDAGVDKIIKIRNDAYQRVNKK